MDNALEYNPENYNEERMIRHRACLLKDFAFEMVERELDPNFEKTCAEIKIARALRGGSSTKHAPNFVDVNDEEQHAQHLAQQKELFAREFGAKEFEEGEQVWAEHNGTFYLAKVAKVDAERADAPFYVHYLHFNKVRKNELEYIGHRITWPDKNFAN